MSKDPSDNAPDTASEAESSDTPVHLNKSATAAAEGGDAKSRPVGKKAAGKKGAGKKDETADAGKSTKNDGDAQSASSGQISLTISKSLIYKVLAVLAVVAVVVVIAVGAWQLVEKNRRLAAFDDVKAASDTFVTALVSTTNAANAGSYKEKLGPLSTGDLRDRLEKERADTEKSVADLRLQVTSKILVSAVESFDNDSAKALVMAEVTGTSAKLPSGASNLMVFRLDLQKVNGSWLVSKFDGPPGSKNGQIDPSQSLPGSQATPTPTP